MGTDPMPILGARGMGTDPVPVLGARGLVGSVCVWGAPVPRQDAACDESFPARRVALPSHAVSAGELWDFSSAEQAQIIGACQESG